MAHHRRSEPVAEFRTYYTQRRSRILIAANGISDDPEELSRAHALGISALARGIKFLIMTTAEIHNHTCTTDLTGLLNRRYRRAIASGGLGTPQQPASSQTRDLKA